MRSAALARGVTLRSLGGPKPTGTFCRFSPAVSTTSHREAAAEHEAAALDRPAVGKPCAPTPARSSRYRLRVASSGAVARAMPWEGDSRSTAALGGAGATPSRSDPSSGARAGRGSLRTRATPDGQPSRSAPAPIYDVIEAARLYQALYWELERLPYQRRPATSSSHSMGWSGIPPSSRRRSMAPRSFHRAWGLRSRGHPRLGA